jgi:predicted ester cyclase
MKHYIALSLGFITLFSIGCGRKGASVSTDSTAATANTSNAVSDNRATVVKFYDMMNAKDWSKLDQYIAPEFVDHDPEPGQGPGVAGLKASFGAFQHVFPDFHFAVDQTVAETDLVAVRFHMTGTNTGSAPDMPASNKKVNVAGFDLIRFKNGKAIEHWGLNDNMKMAQQMGMMGGGDSSKSEMK